MEINENALQDRGQRLRAVITEYHRKTEPF